MNERVQRLRAAGVSIWLDTLSRELLDTGEFGRLIGELGVSGATSNPTIFAKAITGSDRYDHQLRSLVQTQITDPQQLFFSIALDDVRAAADLLQPTYEQSGGSDGFVSFECTPDLADQTEATIEQALARADTARIRRPRHRRARARHRPQRDQTRLRRSRANGARPRTDHRGA